MLFQNQQLILKFQRFQQFPAFLQIDLFKCSLIIRLIGLTTLFHCLPCSRQRFASKGLSGFVLYIQQVSTRSSVYPVKDELSTFIPFDSTIRISAGIFFPSSIWMRSHQFDRWNEFLIFTFLLSILCSAKAYFRLILDQFHIFW